MLRNPILGRLLAVAHAVLAFVCLCFLAFLIVEMKGENPPEADEKLGAVLLVLVVALVAAILMVVSAALWKRKRWGWVLGYVADGLVVMIFLFGITFDSKNSGVGDWVGIAIFLPLAGSFFLPGVRNYLFASRVQSQEN